MSDRRTDGKKSTGRPSRRPVLHDRFTTRQLARHAGMTPARIRHLVYAGLLRPTRGARRRFEYSLQDLLALRATRQLTAAHFGARRIGRMIADLRRRLDGSRDLAGLQFQVDRDGIVVTERGKRWRVDSGQLLLRFDPPKDPTPAIALDGEDTETITARRVHDLLSRAEAVEGRDAAAARRFYMEALALDPTHVATHVNLGRVLHESGELDRAEHHYGEALRLAPQHAVAAFNLAVLAEDRGDTELALRRYRRTVQLAPSMAEAHRCLARLLQARGRRGEATRHRRASRHPGTPPHRGSH